VKALKILVLICIGLGISAIAFFNYLRVQEDKLKEARLACREHVYIGDFRKCLREHGVDAMN